jgi:hypothetical protein
MNRWAPGKFLASATIIAASVLVSVPLFGQSVSDPPSKASASSAATAKPTKKKTPATKSWTLSRTPDGQPDLQGMWVNFDSTPFEKPDPAAPPTVAAPEGKPSPTTGMALPTVSLPFGEKESSASKRPSMVVDPPNGRVPLTPWAEQTRDYFLAHVQDSWEYNTPWERCITRGVPGGIFPVAYDNAYQILQTPGYVVILYDMIHDTRIIPLDGRPHISDEVRQWNGDPRGHWEGNTLVVESTNFNGKGMYGTANLNGRIRDIPETDGAYIVERFTRTGEKTIEYNVTIKDARAFTAPWKVAMPLTLDNTFQMYEYACHEGNQNYMEITLGAGRTQDKAVEDTGKTK